MSKGPSEHWNRKINTYFERIDFDKDGVITRKDFEGMAERFIKDGKLDEAKAKDLRSTLTAVWDKYMSAVGGGDGINKPAFLEGMKKLKDNADMKAVLEGPLPLFFHAVDTNDDGMIDEGEFGKFFQILGLDPSMAPASFKAIDTNNDGQLSKEEFVQAGSDFFLSEDEKEPHQVFWGPLV